MLNRPAPDRPTRLEEAKGALIQVLRNMAPEARVQVWSFNTRMIPVPVDGVREGSFIPIGKGGNREAIIGEVRALRTAGGTNLYSSVVKALALFAAPRDQALYRAGRRYPVLVVVSDGEDGGKTRETLETVQEEKKRHPLVTVNAIGFALERERQWFEVLCRIATRPEGCAKADDGAQLQAMLDSFYRPRR
jgi:hypothetical protein